MEFELFECFHIEIHTDISDTFIYKWIDNLRDKTINASQFCCKQFKSNIQQLHLVESRTYNYFWVDTYIVFKLYIYHKEP